MTSVRSYERMTGRVDSLHASHSCHGPLLYESAGKGKLAWSGQEVAPGALSHVRISRMNFVG
eukprot:3278262-Rhodomonas_salina.1